MNNIKLVQTYKIDNEEQLVAYHKKFLQENYEGTILRHSDSPYEINKRSSSLLKYKDFLDEAFEVVDIVPSESRPTQGVVVCKTINKLGKEVTFNTGMKFSHQEREEILTNKKNYIGSKAEVRYFELSDEGICRFPVCVGFRLDK